MRRVYTYKFRLSPTPSQVELLNKHFGCVRFVYNYFLDRRVKHYLRAKEKNLGKKSLNYYDDAVALTRLKHEPDTDWLSEVNAQSLQQSLKHLDTAFNRFYKKKAKFPRFKKRGWRDSFRVPQYVSSFEKKLFIRYFPEGIKIDAHRSIEGVIRNATISKTSSGKFYASIQVIKEIEPLPVADSTVGVDLGVNILATLSNRIRYPNLRFTRNHERKLRILQKALSRTKKDSRGREKAKRRVAVLHEKIANKRSNHLHKISRKIVNENQVIILESLNVAGMVRNRCLAKSLSDCSFGELVRQILYKAEWAGRKVVQVSRWFPSSKTCNSCGYINDGLKQSDRSWICPRCGVKHQRDLNAARNILTQGLNLLNKDSTAGTAGLADCPGVRQPVKRLRLVGSED